MGEGPILPAALARHSSSSCIQSSGGLPKLKFQLSYFILVFDYKVMTPSHFLDDELRNEFLSYVQVDMEFYVNKDLS